MKKPKKAETTTVTIQPPNFQTAIFHIRGTAPLVIHRMSAKLKQELLHKQEGGKVTGNKKNREPKDSDKVYNEARYQSKEGWDGFQASAMRNAAISACRVAGFQMVLAKLSLFVQADGYDAKEPQIGLIRIYGGPVRQDDLARVKTGQPYVAIRPAYHNWQANITMRWDADQFTLTDITNLLMQVGLQVGIGEGRPDSKCSAGMGRGLFEIEKQK